ncbi:chaplin [Actinomadura litoris]|uniref:chaplin n=1 Tax=Actinomadura litoris TaxID=2678616 RepID=UPI001FA74D9C|nr:chaplin [Actinomadura litoris]
MRIWSKNTGRAALVAAASVALGAAGLTPAASADPGGMHTSGMFSVLGGNQVYAPISVPVEVSGNAIAVLGVAQAGSKGGAHVSNARHGGGGGGGMQTSGMFSILGGNQIYAPISAPINVCGNAVAVLGVAKAWCKGGAHVTNKRSGGPDMKTSGMFSIGGGNQVYLPVSVPINICGNAIAVLGVAQAYCEGGATVNNGGKEERPPKVWPKEPHKPYKPRKPRKHRPATVHHKLPSTDRLLTDGSAKDRPGTDRPAADRPSADRRATQRLAAPRPGPRPGAPRPAAEPGLPVVRDLTGGTPLPGNGAVQTSLQKKAPVTVGAPLLS